MKIDQYNVRLYAGNDVICVEQVEPDGTWHHGAAFLELDRVEARALAPILAHFAETGQLPEDDNG